jgi:Cu2+-exporting ATPase
MTTSIVEVGGMLSSLSASGDQKQLMKLPGVEKAEVNYVSGSATVIHDTQIVSLESIQMKVRDCGYYCSGELLPKHVCKAATSQ